MRINGEEMMNGKTYFGDILNHIGWLGHYEELRGARVPGESSRSWRAWQRQTIRS